MILLTKALVLMAALALAAPAHADTSILAGAWSKHMLSDNDYNETHNLLAIEHKNLFAGYFLNSYSEDTFAAAYKWSSTYGPVEVGMYIGGMYGYRDCVKGYADRSRRICPMVAPFVTVDVGVVSPQIYLLGEALAVGVRINL